MTKLPALTQIDLGEVFPKSVTDRAEANANGPVQQQQRQDPQWLAEVKRRQQQSQSWQL